MSRQREPDEGYVDYRRTIEREQADLDRYLKGRLIWDSRTLGPAVSVKRQAACR
jgi:hypothetical protein